NSSEGAAAVNAPRVTQTQSIALCANSILPYNPPASCLAPGGLVGTINQDSSGVSTATPTQNEFQCEDAATSGLSVAANCPAPPATPTPPDSTGLTTLTQTQYGPVGVGNLRHQHRG